jgi:methylmalonyl-CoA mutase, N-terminal domain
VENGERVIVGVNRFEEDDTQRVELLRIDPEGERRQIERTARVRAERNADAAATAVAAVRAAAQGRENLLPALRDALRAYCTVGELCETLREEWGMYDAVRSRA